MFALCSRHFTDKFEAIQRIILGWLNGVLYQFGGLLGRRGRMIWQTFEGHLLFGHQFAGVLIHLCIVNAQSAENGERFDYGRIGFRERLTIFLFVLETRTAHECTQPTKIKMLVISALEHTNNNDAIAYKLVITLLSSWTTPMTVFWPLIIGIQSAACVVCSSSSTIMSGCSAVHWPTSTILNNWPVDETNWAICANDVFKSFIVGRIILGVWLSWAMSKIMVKRAREFCWAMMSSTLTLWLWRRDNGWWWLDVDAFGFSMIFSTWPWCGYRTHARGRFWKPNRRASQAAQITTQQQEQQQQQ